MGIVPFSLLKYRELLYDHALEKQLHYQVRSINTESRYYYLSILSSQKHFNLWNYKPWWCQPWSILLTGALIISGSWILFQTAWVTLLVSLPVAVWWTYFLILLPRLLNRSGMLQTQQRPPQDFSQEGRWK